jgi:hypothetical protein
MTLPTRIANHRTETLAVRQIIGHISADWLIRNMDERDYGIDLMFEVFNSRFPTGRIAFVQSKGTEDAFQRGPDNCVVLNNFPVKTIEYALRLSAPFFVFYTSLESSETVFAWIQRYALTKLGATTPNWREQESATLYFPDENNLRNGHVKIETILHSEQLTSQTVEVLRNTRWLRKYVGSILSGQHAVAKAALESLAAITGCNAVVESVLNTPGSLDLAQIKSSLSEILDLNRISEANTTILAEIDAQIEEFEDAILDKPDMEHHEHEMTGASPLY